MSAMFVDGYQGASDFLMDGPALWPEASVMW